MSPKKKRQSTSVKDLPPKASKKGSPRESGKVKGGSMIPGVGGAISNVDLQRPIENSLLTPTDLSGKAIGRAIF